MGTQTQTQVLHRVSAKPSRAFDFLYGIVLYYSKLLRIFHYFYIVSSMVKIKFYSLRYTLYCFR